MFYNKKGQGLYISAISFQKISEIQLTKIVHFYWTTSEDNAMKREQRKHPRYRVEKEVMIVHDGNVGQLYDLRAWGDALASVWQQKTHSTPQQKYLSFIPTVGRNLH